VEVSDLTSRTEDDCQVCSILYSPFTTISWEGGGGGIQHIIMAVALFDIFKMLRYKIIFCCYQFFLLREVFPCISTSILMLYFMASHANMHHSCDVVLYYKCV